MCAQSQSGQTFEDVDCVSNFFDKQRKKSGIPCSPFQGVSRTISCTMPNSNFNIPAHLLKTEIWIRLAGLYYADYVVVLDGIGIDVNVMSPTARGMKDVSSDIRDTRSCYLKKPMFVGIREVSNDAQERRKDWMRSIEGLKMLKSIPKFGEQAAEFLVKGFREVVGIVNDEEAETLFVAGRSVNRRHLTKSMDEVIEDGSEIIDTVPDNDRPSNKIRGWSHPQHSHSYSGHFRATLEKGLITATVQPSLDFRIDRLEVFFSAV
jgi:hypothetical protein